MKKRIDIIPVTQAKTEGCGSGDHHHGHGHHHHHPHGDTRMAAGIDTDIFEADDMSLENERFWESFWQTQHTYGGIHEGQSLESMLGALDERLFDKLRQDIHLIGNPPPDIDDEVINDIWGMVIFLLCIEKDDAQYDPIQEAGLDGTLARFASKVEEIQQRRTKTTTTT